MSEKKKNIFKWIQAVFYWLCTIFTNHKKPY